MSRSCMQSNLNRANTVEKPSRLLPYTTNILLLARLAPFWIIRLVVLNLPVTIGAILHLWTHFSHLHCLWQRHWREQRIWICQLHIQVREAFLTSDLPCMPSRQFTNRDPHSVQSYVMAVYVLLHWGQVCCIALKALGKDLVEICSYWKPFFLAGKMRIRQSSVSMAMDMIILSCMWNGHSLELSGDQRHVTYSAIKVVLKKM